MESNFNIEDILVKVEDYINNRDTLIDFYQLIEKFSNFCFDLNSIELVSVFLLNEDTFEFEIRYTQPKELRSLSSEIYQYMLERGIVGEVLESASHKIIEIQKNDNIQQKTNKRNIYTLLPLISSNKAIGLLILKLKEETDSKQRDLIISILKILSNHLAVLLENNILLNTIDKTTDFVDQEAALKSISIKRNLIELETIINALEIGVFVVDPETDQIVLSNYYSAKLTGYKQTELNNKRVTDIFLTENLDILKSEQKDLFILGSKNFESKILSSTGKHIPILRSISFANIRSKKYRIDSFIDFTFKKDKDELLEKEIKDLELKYKERTEDLLVVVSKLKEEIREKEKAQKDIQLMLEKEKELNILKSNFITMVSHEFRSPLTKIKSAAQMIDKFGDKLTENEKNDYIKRIISTVDQISGLIENVSLIAGTDLFDFTFEPKETDVLLLLRQLISSLNINFGKSDKIVLSTDCDKLIINIDEKLIKSICFNALNNIVKYSNEERQISLFVSESDDKLVIIFNDIILNMRDDEIEIIKSLITKGKLIDNIPANCINWSVVVKSVQIHKGMISLIEKENNSFSVIINIPIIKVEK
ncbi:MAG: hypothetical protein N2319_00590 [Candidatus Kapabacteria bacterium]|nr:hypothetical protein [Candidatus Kapabacteria bacterium]